MSKERLEEAKKLIKHYHEQKRSNNVLLTERGVELIEHLYEQAERVQELEEELEKGETLLEKILPIYKRLKKQNKRYREALEFYANKINHLTFIKNGKSNIEHDQGEKARKALEGEE